MIHHSVPNSGYILTADIGGTHITAGICDLRNQTIIPGSIIRADVDSKGTADTILTSWTDALKKVIHRSTGLNLTGLSMAMPGPFDYENGISFITGLDKYEALYQKDIRNYFATKLDLNLLAIRFRNDAESTISGEIWAGAGKGYHRIMGVTLGTGFGSAFSEDQITRDINLGSDPYRDSIADDYFSTRWFVKRYRELTGNLLSGGVKELAALGVDNPVVIAIFNDYAINMAGFLSGPIGRYKPDALIVCGNIAKASTLFLPQLRAQLRQVEIQLAQLDEQAPLIGAASLFKPEPKPIHPDPLNQL